ncbi:hypothetical protein A2U01_0102204, partial [Trifolium medium]|nr:hypothetical protein [Trifolium medium]
QDLLLEVLEQSLAQEQEQQWELIQVGETLEELAEYVLLCVLEPVMFQLLVPL